ncbi:MAG: TIGR01212 family radical SAM protein, partial [Candidatus Omnitrophota bacterium]
IMKERYRKFSTYLKERFGVRVHKVSIDSHFSCPNRDGKVSRHGCIYCDNKAFSFQSRTDTPPPLTAQIEAGMRAAREKFKAEKFILYFQAYTNTYAPLCVLKERYDVIRKFDDMVGLSIATRPDCVNEEILDLIDSYCDDYDVWIEYGLQSIHNTTLDFINRGHRYEEFLKAVELTRKRGIKICAHVILGFPFETKEMMMETARALAELRLDGVKIHPLHIIKGTRLEELSARGRFRTLKLEAYLETLADFLGYLPPEMVIHRVSAYCPPELLIAPSWVFERNKVEQQLEKYLEEKDLFQGRCLSANSYRSSSVPDGLRLMAYIVLNK